jgi:integrase
LTALQVERCKQGRLNDGGGLYFLAASRSWVFRYGAQGKRWHGLGPLHTIGLAEARERARLCRLMLLDGADPIVARREQVQATRLDATKAMTFAQCADAYHEAHKAGWRHPRHAHEWRRSLRVYADPILGALSIAAIDTPLVLKVLEPIWDRPTLGHRVRQRIETTLDWAKARKLRDGDNPARLRGHLDHLLAKRKRVEVEHHAALPYRDVPAFMARLRELSGSAARCLEFTILTATRGSGPTRARWNEIDLRAREWTIPGARMKSGREHRIPCSEAALAVLRHVGARTGEGFVFPGRRPGRSVTSTMLLGIAKEIDPAVTVHGFRSSFRDWVSEQTSFPDIVAEIALAHTVGGETERAYRRGELLEKRRLLMQAWGEYCTRPPVPAAIVPLRRHHRGRHHHG